MKALIIITTVGIVLGGIFVPSKIAAQTTEYQLLAPIPLNGVDAGESKKATASTYIKGLFQLIIAIATGLAVLAIIFGGIKYMSTDAFSGKSEAKNTIQNALWGLLLAISAWLILNTINPNLTKFNLSIPAQSIPTTPTPVGGGGSGGGGGGGSCTGCVTVGVPHKLAPFGCAMPGPCVVTPQLNTKLLALRNEGIPFLVTEAYPPTRTHKDSCHQNGQCVDATLNIISNPQNIKNFVDRATAVGLRAVFEVTTEARAYTIRQASGLSASQVIVEPGITGEHFSIYMQ